MKIGKRIVSIFMILMMVISVFSVGFSSIAVSAVELKDIELKILDIPEVNFKASDVTRVAAGLNSMRVGNTIVKATPSGVPELTGDYEHLAYDGETPSATKVTFSTDYAISNLTAKCTNGAVDLVLSSPEKSGNTTTWEVLSGKANAGDKIEFTATYDYNGKTFSSKCYSTVKGIAQGGTRVKTWTVYKKGEEIFVRYDWYACVSMFSRLLGKGVSNRLSNYDENVGYYNPVTDTFTSEKSEGYETVFLESYYSGSSKEGDKKHNFPMNSTISISDVYADISTVSTLDQLNLRFNVLSCERATGNDHRGQDIKFISSFVNSGLVEANSNPVEETFAANTLRYTVNSEDYRKFSEHTQITSAKFHGELADINDGDAFTILNHYYGLNEDISFYNYDIIDHTYVPSQLVFHIVDKSALRSEINNVLSSNPTSPLVSNSNKGKNPQSWFYKSGYQSFASALANACAVLNNDTATQSQIDSATESLGAMYSNLVLNTADYSKVDSLLAQANALLNESDMYTASSVETLERACNMVKQGYNILFQSAVDQMADNLEVAINAVALKDVKVVLKAALDLTPEYGKDAYDAATYEAWEKLCTEGWAMYNDPSVTDADTILAKADEIKLAYNSLVNVVIKDVELNILENPVVNFTASGITRVADASNSQKIGTQIVKATPSGVGETSGPLASLAYDGETPVSTTISFSTDYAIENLSVTCTAGATNLVLSSPVTSGNTLTWTILSGEANDGDSIEFTASYNYQGRSYVTRCYSPVKCVTQGGARVKTWTVYEKGTEMFVRYDWYAVVSVNTRLLGKGVSNTLTSYDTKVGYYDVANDQFTVDKTNGYTSGFFESYYSGSSKEGDKKHDHFMNSSIYVANVYVDTSVTKTLSELNLRLNTIACEKETGNNHKGESLIYEGTAVQRGAVNATKPMTNDQAAADVIGYNVNLGDFVQHSTNTNITTANLTGHVSDLADGDTFTITNHFSAENPDISFYNYDIIDHTYVPTHVVFHLVDKSGLRAMIDKALTSDPVSPLISNEFKGANPQSWYYKSGFNNFRTALKNAYAVLLDDTADQNTIDGAKDSLEMMYSNLVLNSADYSKVESLLEQADELLQDSDIYTKDSFDLLNEAYDSVKYNYNILYQSSVDTMAQNLENAINGMKYADADYSAVDTAINNADTSAYVQLVNDAEGKTYNYAGQTIPVYSPEFVQTVLSYVNAIEEAESSVVRGLDITKQDQVNGYAKAINDAYSALTLMSADYTAANTVKAYAMTLNSSASNYKNFTAVRTAVNKLKTGYSIDKQADVNTVVSSMVDAINALQLKDATKAGLKTALDLTPKYDKSFYVAADYEAWEKLHAEGQAMYDDTTLTILDNATITAKANEITAAFNNLKATVDLTPLTTALALVPEYNISYYTDATAKAYTDAVAAGNALVESAATLTVEDNARIVAAANEITDAYNALTLKNADYTAFNTAVSEYQTAENATVSVVTYEVGGTTDTKDVAKYTADSLADVKSYIDECDTNLLITSQEIVNEYTLTINTKLDALEETVDKSELEKAVAEIETLTESDYTAETWSAYSDAIANAGEVTTQEAVNNAVTAIAEARLALEEDGQYVFVPETETTTVIDEENKFIYGLEEGITDLDGFVEYENCTLNYIPTEAGFGTGSTVEVIYKGEVVDTYTIVIFGDVTGDGYIDSFDAAVLLSVANFESELEEESAYALAGDLTGDGFIDSFDTAMLISASNFELEISQVI